MTVFFEFPLEIRKIIYTTNLIENLNGNIKKYNKNKLSFPIDDAVKKICFLCFTRGYKKMDNANQKLGSNIESMSGIIQRKDQALKLNPSFIYLHT
ncbi:transposase [Flammeovirga sp. OC4]|uniref:transposase n=1 Tax=Flammeovirga sp. OC4 TaxID=1382345 RepID=UPI0005C4B559|nr:transposase [Flammeovirga sp. OC4]